MLNEKLILWCASMIFKQAGEQSMNLSFDVMTSGVRKGPQQGR